MSGAKHPAAVTLGRLGGLARAARLSPARRVEIATTASHARKTKRGWPKGQARTKPQTP